MFVCVVFYSKDKQHKSGQSGQRSMDKKRENQKRNPHTGRRIFLLQNIQMALGSTQPLMQRVLSFFTGGGGGGEGSGQIMKLTTHPHVVLRLRMSTCPVFFMDWAHGHSFVWCVLHNVETVLLSCGDDSLTSLRILKDM
jgi:hypothetical protein